MMKEKKWIFIVLCGVILLLVAFELFFRFFDPLSALDPSHRILYKPNAYKSISVSHSKLDPLIEIKTNNLGFRGENYSPDEKKRIRIVALGGGATYSFYNSEGQTWLDQSFLELKKDFPLLWMNNAGGNYQPLTKSVSVLKDLLSKKVKIDYALVLTGQDDIGKGDEEKIELNQDEKSPWLEKSEFAYFIHSLSSPSEVSPYDLKWDIRQTTKLELKGEELSKMMMEHSKSFLPYYRRRLEAFVRFCQENGITPILMTQPTLFGRGSDLSTSVDLANIKFKEGNSLQYSLVLEMYNDVTRVIARKSRLPLIDLARSLPKDSSLYFDHLHLTNKGSEKVATIVVPVLKSQLSQKN